MRTDARLPNWIVRIVRAFYTSWSYTCEIPHDDFFAETQLHRAGPAFDSLHNCRACVGSCPRGVLLEYGDRASGDSLDSFRRHPSLPFVLNLGLVLTC